MPLENNLKNQQKDMPGDLLGKKKEDVGHLFLIIGMVYILGRYRIKYNNGADFCTETRGRC